jgi:hypothetical protein
MNTARSLHISSDREIRKVCERIRAVRAVNVNLVQP